MKTLKALKITSVLNGIFCFICIASTVCFALNHFYDLRDFFSIGLILSCGWMFNPTGMVSFIVCLAFFLEERKNQEAKLAMGRKWILIFVWPIITTVFWLAACVLMVEITGGA